MLEKFFKAYNELYPRSEVTPVKVETPVETFTDVKQREVNPISENTEDEPKNADLEKMGENEEGV